MKPHTLMLLAGLALGALGYVWPLVNDPDTQGFAVGVGMGLVGVIVVALRMAREPWRPA